MVFLLLGIEGCFDFWNGQTQPNQANCVAYPAACSATLVCNQSTGACEDPAHASSDMACVAPPPSDWIADAPSGLLSTQLLYGVIGTSTDLWITGDNSFAYYRGPGGWNTLPVNVPITGLTLGRAAYAGNSGLSFTLGNSMSGRFVLQLSTTNTQNDGLLPMEPTTLTGLWVSPVTGVPFVASSDGSLSRYDGSLMTWSAVSASMQPASLTALSGTVQASGDVLWGASGNSVVAYQSTTNAWSTPLATPAGQMIAAVWAGPMIGQSVWMVGPGGVIMTVAGTTSPLGTIVPQPSPVRSDLADIMGTADGQHIWAVGANGTIVHWEAVCKTWTVENSPTVTDLTAVWVNSTPGQQTVWVVGQGTVIRRAIP